MLLQQRASAATPTTLTSALASPIAPSAIAAAVAAAIAATALTTPPCICLNHTYGAFYNQILGVQKEQAEVPPSGLDLRAG